MAKKILVLAVAVAAILLLVVFVSHTAYNKGICHGYNRGWDTGYNAGFDRGLHEGTLTERIRADILRKTGDISDFNSGFERGYSTAKASGRRWP